MEREIMKDFYYGGDSSFSFYLLKGEKNILVDSATLNRTKKLNDFLEKNLKDGENLDYVLLTHSHYDHCGGVPMLKEIFPKIEVWASERAASIFSKEKARAFIKEMNRAEAGKEFKYDNYETLKVDKILKEGDLISNGNFEFTIFETPGHTKCSISFYDKEKRILFPGDAVGIFEKNGKIKPLFFSNYSTYINSLKRLSELEVNILALPHNRPVEGKKAKEFLKKSYEKTLEIGEKIKELLLKGDNEDSIVNNFLLKIFKKEDAIDQPMETFMLNLYSLVRAVAKEI